MNDRHLDERIDIADFVVIHEAFEADLAVVAQIADRVAVLQYGQIVEEGEISQILDNPQHEYTQSLWTLNKMSRGEPDTADKDDQPLLSVEGVSARYGDLDVITDVTLRVDKGTTVALVGESGSGKSTLGRVITGLKAPSQGDVLWSRQPFWHRK